MTGGKHYREAERRLEQAHTVDPAYGAYLVAKAQAHATLALVAATVLTTGPADRKCITDFTKTVLHPESEG